MSRTLVAFDLETEMIPERRKVLSKGGKPSNVTAYVTPRPVIASTCIPHRGTSLRGVVWDMAEFYEIFPEWVDKGYHILGQNHASFDLDVLYTFGPPRVQRAVVEALDKGLIIDTKLLDWLIRLAEGEFDMPIFNPDTRRWSVPQPKVRSLAALAKDLLDVELDKDPEVRCGYAQFLNERSPKRALPEKFRIYAEQDAVTTYRVGKLLLERADSIDPQPRSGALFGPLSCALQARASFIAHQMDKEGIGIDQDRAIELRALFQRDEGPLQDRLVEYGLGKWKPVPKAERHIEDNLPLDTEDIPTWTKRS